jgi:hypothetical protein
MEEQFLTMKGHVGQTSSDPAALLALRLYATTRKVGSARELGRLSEVAGSVGT